jgi:hypothetical protein
MRPDVVRSRAGVEPRTTLSLARLDRAARRLTLLPGASASRVTFAPRGGAGAVNLIVEERPRAPNDWTDWAAIGGRAIFSDELKVSFANLTRGGGLWSLAYRWSDPRERFAAQFETPVAGLPGVVAVDGLVERQTYDLDQPGLFVEGRRRLGLSLTDWASKWWRWSGGGAIDRIGPSTFVAVEGGTDIRALGDHVSVIATAGTWWPTGAQTGDGFRAGLVAMAWRSSTTPAALVFHGDIGASAASTAAPLAMWPGSHTSAERGGSLRAHPLRHDDVIDGEVFGRRVAFATVTVERLLADTKFARVALAGFADLGQAWQRVAGRGPSLLHVDVGIGLRVSGAGAGIRLDIARGVRDGRTHFSAGYVKDWPGR